MNEFSGASRIVVLHEGANPTSDFYLTPRLALQPLPVEWITLKDRPDAAVFDKAAVVVVRYLTPAWKGVLDANYDKLFGCFWLIDDDLLDFSVLLRVSGGLGWKWFWRAWRFKSWFKRKGVKLWVSTPYLEKKYAAWSPRVMPPCSPYPSFDVNAQVGVSSLQPAIVFYHGSISHRHEQRWLYPVFAAVAKRCPEVVFEVIGSASVAHFFASIPQVKVHSPMSWNHYKVWIQKPGRTLGLAPLLDNHVNAARAPTRFYDIQAAGAIGLFAKGPVYEAIVKQEGGGMLLPMDQQVWIDEIIRLVNRLDA